MEQRNASSTFGDMQEFGTTRGAVTAGAPYEVHESSSGDIVRRTGRALSSAAARLRSRTQPGSRTDTASQMLDRTGRYLETRQMDGLRRDAERTIIARPLITLAVALVLGYVTGRAVRS